MDQDWSSVRVKSKYKTFQGCWFGDLRASLTEQTPGWVLAVPFACCVPLDKSPPVSGPQLSLEKERAGLDHDFFKPVTN